jgi:hypothetical protein
MPARSWLIPRRKPRPAPLLRPADPLDATVASLLARTDRLLARADRQDARIRALFAAMGDASQAAGLPAPDKDETAPIPRLTLVRRGA